MEGQMPERGYYRFVLKKDARGHFWIAAEATGATIKSLDDCVLGFELDSATTHEDAIAITDLLNQRIHSITLT
jgi:hypothetical protein